MKKVNKELIDNILAVTSRAAISCHKFLGKNDSIRLKLKRFNTSLD